MRVAPWCVLTVPCGGVAQALATLSVTMMFVESKPLGGSHFYIRTVQVRVRTQRYQLCHSLATDPPPPMPPLASPPLTSTALCVCLVVDRR